uniref:hypothetical protein n=1 Tax=Aeromonas jandaei TaxID=650 RepID=UPI001E551665
IILINNRHCNGACYGAGLWLDFPFTVLLLTTWRSRKNDAGGRKHPKISLRDSGRAQTDRHSLSCIVMQRAENVPDAFFLFTPGKASLFAVFSPESR